MADAQKRDGSVNLKEKEPLLDFEIGEDFFANWKPMSTTEGDEIDFGISPVEKTNKKPFKFNKVDMDFNLDGDFDNIASFNVDMPDFDISPKLKKDGKSVEKSEESSIKRDKGNADNFGLDFDIFDGLDNFNMSGFTKDCSKSHDDANKKESSSNGSQIQRKEGSTEWTGKTNDLGHGIPKISLIDTLDLHSLVGGNADLEPPSKRNDHFDDKNKSEDLEPTRKSFSSKLPVDDAVSDDSEHGSAAAEISSSCDQENNPSETTIMNKELPQICQFEKSVSAKPLDLETRDANAVVKVLSSETPSNTDQINDDSLEAVDKVNDMHKSVTGSNGNEDFNTQLPANSLSKRTISKDSHLLAVAKPKENSFEESRDGIKDQVIINSEIVEPGNVDSQGQISYPFKDVTDTPSNNKNLEPASKNLEFPTSSRPSDHLSSERETGDRGAVIPSRSLVQSEKPEALIQTKVTSINCKKTGFSQSSLFVKRRDCDRKLTSLHFQKTKPLLTKELPQMQSQESSNSPNLTEEVGNKDKLLVGKSSNDSFTAQCKEMVTEKQALEIREESARDLNSLSSSMEIQRNSGNSSTLPSLPTLRNNLPEKVKLTSTDLVGKSTDLRGLKLSSIKIDPKMSPVRKDTKLAGNIDLSKVLPRNTALKNSRFAELHKQTCSTLLATKRKTLDEYNAEFVGIHPSKRLSPSSITNRNIAEKTDSTVEEKVSEQNNLEDDNTKRTEEVAAGNEPNVMSIEEVKIPFLFESNSNIKQAEAYSKELDDLCNMLRKKQEEAKDILVNTLVNSNKLLLLDDPAFNKRISFKLTTNYTHRLNNFISQNPSWTLIMKKLPCNRKSQS